MLEDNSDMLEVNPDDSNLDIQNTSDDEHINERTQQDGENINSKHLVRSIEQLNEEISNHSKSNQQQQSDNEISNQRLQRSVQHFDGESFSQRFPVTSKYINSQNDELLNPRFISPRINQSIDDDYLNQRFSKYNQQNRTLMQNLSTNMHHDKSSNKVQQHSNHPSELPCIEDEYDYIGKNVAAKLRRLPEKIRIISEKLINDVLFQAQLDNLNVDSFIDVNIKNNKHLSGEKGSSESQKD